MSRRPRLPMTLELRDAMIADILANGALRVARKKAKAQQQAAADAGPADQPSEEPVQP